MTTKDEETICRFPPEVTYTMYYRLVTNGVVTDWKEAELWYTDHYGVKTYRAKLSAPTFAQAVHWRGAEISRFLNELETPATKVHSVMYKVVDHQKYLDALGKTRKEVIDLLGKPDDTGGTSRKYPTPSVFLYGNYEIHFGPRPEHKSWLLFDRETESTIKTAEDYGDD